MSFSPLLLVLFLAGYHMPNIYHISGQYEERRGNFLSHSWILSEWVREAGADWEGRERSTTQSSKSLRNQIPRSIPHELNHNPALAAISLFVLLLLFFPPPVSQAGARGQTARPYHSPALSHIGITTPLSHLLQPGTAGRLSLLQATLLITYSLSVTVHLCLWSKSQLMEWGKVKHSNNGDSCFSLFEKIHFVLLSAPSSSRQNGA